MLLIRVVAAFLVAAVGAAVVMYLVTRHPRWLRIAWQVLRIGVLILLIAFGFYALERFLLIV